jgi:hypothetical protein
MVCLQRARFVQNFIIMFLYMRFQVLTVASIKFRVFWNVAPCSQVDVDRRFRGVYCLHHQGLALNFMFLYADHSGLAVGAAFTVSRIDTGIVGLNTA